MSRSVRIFRSGETEILRRAVAATVIWLSSRRCRRYQRYFVAPAVNPPRQYFPSRINAAISGKTLISEPSAIR
jgi:hypothetical protein